MIPLSSRQIGEGDRIPFELAEAPSCFGAASLVLAGVTQPVDVWQYIVCGSAACSTFLKLQAS
jgi:hypothetical protein